MSGGSSRRGKKWKKVEFNFDFSDSDDDGDVQMKDPISDIFLKSLQSFEQSSPSRSRKIFKPKRKKKTKKGKKNTEQSAFGFMNEPSSGVQSSSFQSTDTTGPSAFGFMNEPSIGVTSSPFQSKPPRTSGFQRQGSYSPEFRPSGFGGSSQPKPFGTSRPPRTSGFQRQGAYSPEYRPSGFGGSSQPSRSKPFGTSRPPRTSGFQRQGSYSPEFKPKSRFQPSQDIYSLQYDDDDESKMDEVPDDDSNFVPHTDKILTEEEFYNTFRHEDDEDSDDDDEELKQNYDDDDNSFISSVVDLSSDDDNDNNSTSSAVDFVDFTSDDDDDDDNNSTSSAAAVDFVDLTDDFPRSSVQKVSKNQPVWNVPEEDDPWGNTIDLTNDDDEDLPKYMDFDDNSVPYVNNSSGFMDVDEGPKPFIDLTEDDNFFYGGAPPQRQLKSTNGCNIGGRSCNKSPSRGGISAVELRQIARKLGIVTKGIKKADLCEKVCAALANM